MMHYRCGGCAEVFALERIRPTGSPRTAAPFCPFCGVENGPARVSAQSAAQSLTDEERERLKS